MTIHPLELVRMEKKDILPNKKHRILDDLDPQIYGRRVVAFMPTDKTVDDLLETAKKHLQGLADINVIKKIISYNPNCLWGIVKRNSYDAQHPRAEGFMAFLMLREEGLRQLANGTFDRSNPDLSLLAPQNERPSAIYSWGVYMPPPLIGGIPLVYEKLCSPIYAGISLYSWSATEDGKRLVESIGFKLGAPLKGTVASHLHYYPRGADALPQRPTYDSYIPGANNGKASVTIARTLEDYARVISIRSATYMAEQDCPYKEEYDGNDFSATHFIGYIGDEPAGCLRARYFGSFVKLERLAVRHEYRNSRLSFKLVRAGIDFCRKKGFRKIYGHARKDLVRFWQLFGCKPMPSRPEFAFSEVPYIEMTLDIEPTADVDEVAVGCSPYVMIRPEGQWDKPGILDKSAERGFHNVRE